MTILFSALAAAFAALCVWLAVRIVNRRERWAKWTLAGVIGVPVLYVASFGVSCWAYSREPERGALPAIYLPLGLVLTYGPRPAAGIISDFARLWMKSETESAVLVPDGEDAEGYAWIVRKR